MSTVLKEGKLEIACASCGKTNAVEIDRLSEKPACGSCHADLPAPGEPVELSDANFSDFVSKAKLPVLVDFWAPWCGPCRMMGPVLETLAKKRAGSLLVGKVDTDQSPETAVSFGIRSIPTIILFREGKEVGRQVGAVPLAALEKMLG